MNSVHSKDDAPVWASVPKSDPRLIKGGKIQLMHPNTRRKCAAAQVYFLDYYYDLLNYLYERKNRLKTFNKFLEDEKLSQDDKEKEWTRHCGRERAYLRKRRVRIKLEQFHVLFQIGQGGYGQVFLATKKDTQEVCALKQMSKITLHKYDEIGHILNERDVLTASKSEWLVKLLYAFQDVDHVYLAMEFVPGGDMRTLLNSNGMLLDCHARFYVAEMVTAVDALHQLGYIHRDLKPENFLIDGTGHVKLADFGLSKGSLNPKRVASLRRKLDSIKHKQLTHLKASEKKTFHDSMRKGDYAWHFSVVGSPEYMAPEILEGAEKDGGSPYDYKVDYWSLGCILYEYLAGFPPFTSPNPDEVWLNLYRWQEVLERPIFEDQALNNNFTDLAWDFIKNMLTHANSRYASLDKIKLHSYFNEICWDELRKSEPPFVPQLESETDPSYFDDFSKTDTMQQIYASIERRDLQRRSPVSNDEEVSVKTSNSDPLNIPPRAAFVGFTYRHKARHFTPPNPKTHKVVPCLNTLL